MPGANIDDSNNGLNGEVDEEGEEMADFGENNLLNYNFNNNDA